MELKEETIKALVTVILIGLSLFTALLFITKATGSMTWNFILFTLGFLLAMLIIFGLWLEEEWAYTLSILFFAGGMAYLIWLFVITRSLLPFTFGILVSVSGMVVSIAETKASESEVETYNVKPIERLEKEIDEEIQKTETTTASVSKRGRPKKKKRGRPKKRN